ncbi:MAG: ABC transporter permease subunit [Acholeplasmataceae bacterium]
MLGIPEWLDLGNQIADMIDRFFTWFTNVFGWLFDILRVIIITLLDVVNNLMTATPWWIWLLVVLIFIGFKYFTKISAKIKWLTMIGVLVVWLVLYNVLVLNPAVSLDLGNVTTPWWIFIVFLFFATRYLYQGKVMMAVILSVLLALIGVFGVWNEMINTVTIVIIAVLISLLIGIPMGILMAKSIHAKKILQPLLDMMQTIPSFVYLIPAVMLFSIGRVPATFATIIYAVPPLIRLTYLGIVNVDEEMIEAGKSFGSTPKQLLFKVQLPQALSTIATGINQTTMMAVSMVVIASMIGAGGLGSIVLYANQNIDIGGGFVGGFAIVFLAIILDRLLQGVADKIESTRGGK